MPVSTRCVRSFRLGFEMVFNFQCEAHLFKNDADEEFVCVLGVLTTMQIQNLFYTIL